jgi:hypothetical protein
MSVVAYPLAKHGAKAFARMLRVPQHDPSFLVIHPLEVQEVLIHNDKSQSFLKLLNHCTTGNSILLANFTE